MFKEPQCKVGFYKFCDFRPKWCMTVVARGAQSMCVCVCEIHKNVKLMITVMPGVNDYEQLMKAMVCNTNDRDCMIHRCDKCPGNEAFHDHILGLITKAEMDEDTISFKQWDQREYIDTCLIHSLVGPLVTRSELITTFLEDLCKKVENLTTHHFIAKSQAAFLSTCKGSLIQDCETALVLLDFVKKNYSFIVQDAVQGHHWDNGQAKLHPFAIYHLEEGVVKPLHY